MSTLDPSKYSRYGCLISQGPNNSSEVVDQVTIETNQYGIIDARNNVGTTPASMCRVLMDILHLQKIPSLKNAWGYKFIVQFNGIFGDNPNLASDFHHFRYGVLYNAQDMNNFDFILFELVNQLCIRSSSI